MSRASRLLRKTARALLSRDGDLLQALQAELKHELSSPPPSPSNKLRGCLDDNKVGEFTLVWDNAQTQDLVLRRRCGSGEETLVSALLGPLLYDGEHLLPRHALMKVCVVKPNFDPVLQFDCAVFSQGNESSEFAIRNTNYLASACSLGPFSYRRPIFSKLDSQLQQTLKDYLVSRGINSELTDFLLQYLQQKEQSQYVNWLCKLEALIEKNV